MLEEFADVLNDLPSALNWVKTHPSELNDFNRKGFAPIHLAILAFQPLLVDTLLSMGALVNTETRDGFENTPLHLLALSNAEGAASLASLLIDYGAELIARNRDHQTALHLAVAGDAKLLATVLVEAGADPLLRDHAGHSSLDLAVDDIEMKQILRVALKRT